MTETEVDRLRRLIDWLWGELPADVVLLLDPEIVEQCRVVHEIVSHANDVSPPETIDGCLDEWEKDG